MLTNRQKAMLKTAQRLAGVPDTEYRETLQRIAGVASSTDRRMGNDHLDVVMSFFEAIYWRRVRAGDVVHRVGNFHPFRAEGYWAGKNSAERTSRDEYMERHWEVEIARLESEMAAAGYGRNYCAAIARRCDSAAHYAAALRRTLKTIARPKQTDELCPF